MTNLEMFCITINDSHLEKINKLNYSAVGLGKSIISSKFLRDNSGVNISEKNSNYGEYTFHYWLWKNGFKNLENKWIGFCQYRKFWSIKKINNSINDLENLKKVILRDVPENIREFESILGEPLYINGFKPIKFLKKNFSKMIKKPSLFFNKSQRNISFHFDLMHGDGNLRRAINLLGKEDKNDFLDFVNTEVSFNPHNMFICKSKEILFDYYETIFPWLEKCEKEFGFNLEGYGLKRIYGFLAERFMSYWFKKNTKSTTLPIIFSDITKLD